MATIVTKFSDYIIQSIEYFITQIETELNYRDISGLTSERHEIINVTKQHPLVEFMNAVLNEESRLDYLRSSLLPAISVIPGNMTEGGFTLGQIFKNEVVDSTFINNLKGYQDKTNKQIQNDLLITQNQIETIISEYNRTPTNGMRVERHEWNRNEEILVSVWSDSPDIDFLLGNLLESIFVEIQIGKSGNNSKMRSLQIKPTRGLTNFNFGRTLFGTEFNLTFLNSFNNYIIYTDDVLEDHDFDGTFIIPGE